MDREPRLPNFYILGAGKSGTTSLFRYLNEHPDIYMPGIKEPTFYCHLFQVVDNPIHYLGLFQNAGNKKWVGEASHAYLSCPQSAPALRAFTPEARFLCNSPKSRRPGTLSLSTHGSMGG